MQVSAKEEIKQRSTSPVMIQEGLRLPNISLKETAQSILNGLPPNPFFSGNHSGYASPTNILSDLKAKTQIYDNLQLNETNLDE